MSGDHPPSFRKPICEKFKFLLHLRKRLLHYGQFFISRKPFSISNLIHYKELCVYGTTGSNKRNVNEALELIQKNPDKFKSLISETYRLKDLDKAIKVASNGNKLKIFVECSK